MSTIKSSDEHLTLNADGASKDIKFQANGVEKASISSSGAFTSTTIDATKLTGTIPNFTSTGIDDNADATAITIDSNEQVGIGQTNPSSATGAAKFLHIGSSSNAHSALILEDNNRKWEIQSNDNLSFFAADVEKMRLDSTGKLGIGITSPTNSLHVVSVDGQAANIHSDTNDRDYLGMSVISGLDNPSSSGDCKWIRLADGDDNGRAYIQFKSSSPNAEFVAISDERLKTNIENTDVVGLDVINKLRLIKFDWNETATKDAGWGSKGHQKIGFIAQEVEKIVPEFISEDVNGFKMMGDSGFIPYLIKAVQEQQTQIEKLEARIAALEA